MIYSLCKQGVKIHYSSCIAVSFLHLDLKNCLIHVSSSVLDVDILITNISFITLSSSFLGLPEFSVINNTLIHSFYTCLSIFTYVTMSHDMQYLFAYIFQSLYHLPFISHNLMPKKWPVLTICSSNA